LGAFFFKAPHQKHRFKPFMGLFGGYLRGGHGFVERGANIQPSIAE